MTVEVEKIDRLSKNMDVNPVTALKAPAIKDDRELMKVLGFTEDLAADYLGKSRQALNNGLGSKKSDVIRDDYFRDGEIALLLHGALARAQSFDRSRVREYLERTRLKSSKGGTKSKDAGPWEMIMEQLDPASAVDLADATLVVLFLPDFAFMEESWPEGAAAFRDLWQKQTIPEDRPELIILSTAGLHAEAARACIAGNTSNSVRVSDSEAVNHYLPMVLVYAPGRRQAFWLGADAQFVSAPMYRSPLMTQCLRGMLPEEWRDEVDRVIAASAPSNGKRKPMPKTAGS